MIHGISEILPDQLSRRQDILSTIRQVFEKNRFQAITTPTFEPIEALAKGWDQFLKTNSIQFISDEGTHMVLRPEMTSSIARLISSRRAQLKLPLQLFYMENVFRRNHHLRKQELFQIGCEVIGKDDLESDLSVLHLLVQVIQSVGVTDFKIELGHVEHIKQLTLADQEALGQGMIVNVSSLPPIGDQSILPKGSYLLRLAMEWEKRFPDLKKYLQFNLGKVEPIAYYTGIMFDVLIEGVGAVVGRGGRYNDLLSAYGWNEPAVGFAIEFDQLAIFLEKESA
jgi:ATP phosphoribosyltransferase regulatory subunit